MSWNIFSKKHNKWGEVVTEHDLKDVGDSANNALVLSKDRTIVYYIGDEITLGLHAHYPIPFDCKLLFVTTSLGKPSAGEIQINLQKRDIDDNWIDVFEVPITIAANDNFHDYEVFGEVTLKKHDVLGLTVVSTINDAKDMAVNVLVKRLD